MKKLIEMSVRLWSASGGGGDGGVGVSGIGAGLRECVCVDQGWTEGTTHPFWRKKNVSDVCSERMHIECRQDQKEPTV